MKNPELRNLTEAEVLPILKQIIGGYRDVEKELGKTGGVINTDCDLFSNFFKLQEILIDTIDPDGWISWYIYDNNGGRDGKIVTLNVGGKEVTRKIKTLKDLAWCFCGE